MSVRMPNRNPQSGSERQIQKVFCPDRSRTSPVRAATGGCDCASNCACDQTTFPQANGKSAVDTKLSSS